MDLIFFIKTYTISEFNVIFLKNIILFKWLIGIYVLKYYCLYNDVTWYDLKNKLYYYM